MFPPLSSDLPVSTSDRNTVVNLLIQNLTILSSLNMGVNGDTRQSSSQRVTTVAEALEIARESEAGAQDPTVRNLLETAIASIWSKIEAQPTSYVMTRDEFAVFNYFQHRFQGQQLAVAAKKRYWDHRESTDGN